MMIFLTYSVYCLFYFLQFYSNIQVLDPIQAEQPESRPMVQVYGRKKALSAAGAVLLNGVERLRASETMRMTRNMPDFHIDLLRLRQNWRLKKVSNTIVGDLSYRTAGSKFSQTGVFEVNIYLYNNQTSVLILILFLF